MSLKDAVIYKTMTFPIGMFWSEISQKAYGSQEYINVIISANYEDIPELQRKSVFISESLTLKIPELGDSFTGDDDLPPWRS